MPGDAALGSVAARPGVAERPDGLGSDARRAALEADVEDEGGGVGTLVGALEREGPPEETTTPSPPKARDAPPETLPLDPGAPPRPRAELPLLPARSAACTSLGERKTLMSGIEVEPSPSISLPPKALATPRPDSGGETGTSAAGYFAGERPGDEKADDDRADVGEDTSEAGRAGNLGRSPVSASDLLRSPLAGKSSVARPASCRFLRASASAGCSSR